MTTMPRTSRLHRSRVARVPRPRQPETALEKRDRPREPVRSQETRTDVPRRTIPEPDLVRTGAVAVLGMVLVATLLGTAGGFALLWLVTRMLVQLR